mmetsp:Transcript_60449/g.139417  ORF Transcript_60449/g.139417 Transcript_60449/m.139417 type:complete len:98 (-) Transcript_60449:162-455(-)
MTMRYAKESTQWRFPRLPSVNMPKMPQFKDHRGFDKKMTAKEAAQILNVSRSADRQVIQNAHRKLMLANHPDNGGSTFIATKVNEAKDKLLGGGGGD